MQLPIKRALVAVTVISGLITTANADLVTRLDGQAVYDTDRNITWIANANLALTNQFGLTLSGSVFDDTVNSVGSTGRMTWANANAWITGMNADGGTGYLGFNNWRLPETPQPDASCSVQSNQGASFPLQGAGFGCGSEMGHLNNIEGVAPSKSGLFTNVQSGIYWSGSEFAPDTNRAWIFNSYRGHQDRIYKATNMFAWAVRSGDVGSWLQDPNDQAGGVSEMTLAVDTNGQSSLKPGPRITAGDAVNWTYRVTNNGTTVLNNVRIRGRQKVPVFGSWTTLCIIGTLLPDTSGSCSTTDAAESGPYQSLIVARATASDGTNLEQSVRAFYKVNEAQPLTVNSSVIQPGGTVTVTGKDFQLGARGLIWGGGPYRKGGVNTPGYASSVAVSNGYAYVADGISGLQVIDIRQPSNVEIVGSVDTPAAKDVAVSNGYAYVADKALGLQVIDISQPPSPVIVGGLNILDASSIAVSNGYAYVAVGGFFSSVEVIDISQPSNPKLVGSVDVTSSHVSNITVSNGYAYVGGFFFGVDIIDISQPSNPVITGSLKTPGEEAAGIAVLNDYAFVADTDSGLHMVDISQPSNPVIIGTVGTKIYPSDNFSHGMLSEAKDVTVTANYAFVADGDFGLHVIDFSKPSYPVMVGSLDTLGFANGVTVTNGYAYVVDGTTGLHVIDISKPVNPAIVGGLDTPNSTFRVAISNGYAYILDWLDFFGQRAMEVIDISEPSNPVLVGGNTPLSEFPEYASQITVSNGYAYIGDEAKGGLHVYDISLPDLVLVGSIDLPGDIPVTSLTVSNNYAYMMVSPLLYVIDISQPSNPILMGSVVTSDYTNDFTLSNGHAFAVGDAGLQVIDISNPSKPILAGSVNTPGTANDVTVLNGYAFVTGRDFGLQVINISDPSNPTIAGGVNTPGNAYRVLASNNNLYVADSHGLHVVDISIPLSPVIAGSVRVTGKVDALYDGNIYTVEGNSGLRIYSAPLPSPATLLNSNTLNLEAPAHLLPGIYDVTVLNPDRTLYRVRNALTINTGGVSKMSLAVDTNGQSSLKPGPILTAGDAVNWIYRVTNDGTTVLNNVQIRGRQKVPVFGSWTTLCTIGTLLPDTSGSCSTTDVAVSGPYQSLIVARATASDGTNLEQPIKAFYKGEASTGSNPKLDKKRNIALELLEAKGFDQATHDVLLAEISAAISVIELHAIILRMRSSTIR